MPNPYLDKLAKQAQGEDAPEKPKAKAPETTEDDAKEATLKEAEEKRAEFRQGKVAGMAYTHTLRANGFDLPQSVVMTNGQFKAAHDGAVLALTAVLKRRAA